MNKEILAHKNRPCIEDWIELIFDDFIEMHGDRLYGDDKAVIGGVALLSGRPVTVIGHAKGKNTKQNIERNFGMPHPEGYRKALRLMKQAEKFSRPVICFVDTAGAFCGIGAEERGQGEAIARNLMEMMGLNTPVFSVFTGEGGSGGALALAVSDKIYALEHAVYSVISPRGCASILWKDPSREAEAAKKLKISSNDLLEMQIIEEIIPEWEGAHLHKEKVAELIKRAIVNGITWADEQPALLSARYERYRKFGAFEED